MNSGGFDKQLEDILQGSSSDSDSKKQLFYFFPDIKVLKFYSDTDKVNYCYSWTIFDSF